MKHPIKHILEYVLLRAASWFLRSLGYRAALTVGCLFAWIAFYVFRFRVAEACRRIEETFGTRYSRAERRRIAWISWRNFVFTVIDSIRIPVSTVDWVKSVVEIRDPDGRIKSWIGSGKGAIIATGHTGSWEMAILACHVYGVPLFSLGASQKNKLVDEFINRSRVQSGFDVVLRNPFVLKTIIRRIREGRVLAILSDVRGKTDALPVRFLNRVANVAAGMGFIAHQTAVPVFPIIVRRIGWSRHSYLIHPPIFPDSSLDKRTDALRITQAFFDILCQTVQNEPEQWFWFNRRWIFEPFKDGESQKPAAEDREAGQ